MIRRAAVAMVAALAWAVWPLTDAAAADTVRVSVYVGNGSPNAQAGLVLDTETLVLNEAGETSGVFRSGAVVVEDTDVVADRLTFTDKVIVTEAQVSFVDRTASGGTRSVPSFEKIHPLDRIYPDNAEVPDMAKFAEMNTSLVVWILSSAVAVGVILFLCYRWIRRILIREADELTGRTESEILKSGRDVLAEFFKRYPGHPSARRVAMELGRRYYNDLDYHKSSHYFQNAIKLDSSAKNPEAHFFQAHCLHRLGYLCDAIDEWMACYMDDPKGALGAEALREAQRWRAYQVVHDTQPCSACGAAYRYTDLKCPRCQADLKRSIIQCGVCGKPMVKEAQICIHCLPDDIKAVVAEGDDWPILKITSLDWEAELLKSRLTAAEIPCVLTGEKGRAIPLTVGYLGEIHVRVPYARLAEAEQMIADPGSPG